MVLRLERELKREWCDPIVRTFIQSHGGSPKPAGIQINRCSLRTPGTVWTFPWTSHHRSREDVEAKVAAINAYRTQKSRMFFANDIVGDLARVRGKQIGREYAECFELTRLIV